MNNPRIAKLDALSLGFRSRYLLHAEIEEQLRAWADAFPDIVRVTTIGTSEEGRALSVVSIGLPSERPAAWVDGNMHAQELCGSSVALALAEDAIRVHLAPDAAHHDLPPHVVARLREITFHVLPRMCPDGAEAVLTTGAYVRSNPRDKRIERRVRWVSRDVDGDGQVRLMRKEDPAGEFAVSREEPGLLVPREIEDEGPFYKIFPEGFVEPWDGATLPDSSYLGDNDVDLNRNFPYAWAPEPEQAGAGIFAMSEPETRAVVGFTTAHPEIFAWLNLHTYGGVYIRPHGSKPDSEMDQRDLALYRQIAAWGEKHGGYPTVSGFEEFLYAPNQPLRGDVTEYAYHQRGAIALVCELWDLFRQIGAEKQKPFVAHYARLSREELVKLVRWDREHNAGRAILPWKKAKHPQLGDVEIGGCDPRVGLVNPPYEKLPEVCARQAAFFFRVAAMAPALRVEANVVRDGDVATIAVEVQNDGYLPTYVLASAKHLPWNEGVRVEAKTIGCALVDASQAVREIGHLEGWGRGLHVGWTSPHDARSRGSVSSKRLTYVVRGRGTIELRVGSCRVGFVTKRISVEA